MGDRWTTALRGLRRRQLLSLGAAASALLLVAGVGAFSLTSGPGDDTVDAYLVKAGLKGKRELRIGVFTDEPLMAYRDPRRPDSRRIEDYSGFDVELARHLGRYLGYDAASLLMVPTQVQNRAGDLNEGRVDIVIANYSMTKDRENEVDFAGPYLLTKPEVLMRSGRGVPESITFRELGERADKVCTTGSSTSETALRDHGITGFDGVRQAHHCVEGLFAGKYDAFMSDRTVLLGFADRYRGRLTLVDLVFGQTEYYGIAVADGNEPLRVLCNNFLLDSFHRGSEGAWARAWQSSLGPVLRTEVRQPRPRDVTVRLRDYQNRYPQRPADAS